MQLPPPQVCAAPGRPSLVAELLFGLSIPGGGEISATQFADFVASNITPRFPGGLTVLPASGQWRGPNGEMVSEGSRMVVISMADDDAGRTKLAEIRAAYRARFLQKSVALITIQSCASF